MKYIALAFMAMLLASCLGDNDPGIWGEYTTEAQCLEKGWVWRNPKYISRFSFEGCYREQVAW